MEKLEELTSVELIDLWIDIARPTTHWETEGGEKDWLPSENFLKL